MKLEFSGAARQVTGSKHLIEVNGKRILLDCGLFQGRRKASDAANMQFPFDVDSIDAVVLSHAHIDHSGALPLLAKLGYTGPIYCTHATRDLCSVMLRDSAYIQEKDAEWMKKKKGLANAQPLYTILDAEKCLSLFRSVAYGQRLMVAPGAWVRFHDAGHVLGSAVEEWEIEDHASKEQIRLGFTGDLGRKNLPILKDWVQLSNLDYLITETTYGNRMHEEIGDVESAVCDTVNRTVARGGKILIPAFALGRTQEILYVLHGLMKKGDIPSIPIFVDSPLAKRATEVVQIHPECFDEELQKILESGTDIFCTTCQGNVQFTTSVEDSKGLNNYPGPCIIISASGMCEAGRIRHHLANSITDAKNTVMIVGYMAENTLGRKIVDGESPINIFGEPYELKAEVQIFNAFSGHADKKGLLEFAENAGDLKNIFCVHGEYEGMKSYRDSLFGLENVKKNETGIYVPAPGDRFTLEGGKFHRQDDFNEASRNQFKQDYDERFNDL